MWLLVANKPGGRSHDEMLIIRQDHPSRRSIHVYYSIAKESAKLIYLLTTFS